MDRIFKRLSLKRRVFIAALIVAGAGIAPGRASAQAIHRTKIGMLACDVSSGVSAIIASKKSVACMFTPAQPGPREIYTGSISKYGLDAGATVGGEMVWSVFAPSNKAFGALAGTYSGAGSEATVGAGLGANVLVGGSNRTVALQPLAVQGQTTINVALGISDLILNPAR